MNLGSDVVITITGIVLVFAILVLLMLIIMLEGKIFDNINNKKNGKPAAPKAPAAPARQGCPLPPSPPPLRPRLTTAPFPARSSPRSPLPWPRSAAAMPSFAASSAFPSLPPVPPRCLGRRRRA